MVRAPVQELFVLIGDPVAGNPTQEVVEDAFRRLGLNWRYINARVLAGDLPAAISGLRAMHFRGAHVTIPHKVSVVPLLDQLTPAAELIGAVNCIVNRRGRLVGENTDGKGLVAALSKRIQLAGRRVVLFGAGGAARAIGVELALGGAREIRLINRDDARRASLADSLQRLGIEVAAEAWPTSPITIDADIVVNATSIGMANNALTTVPVEWGAAPRQLVAVDVVIEPQTRFIADARSVGAVVVTGIEMLVEQAILSIELWTGRSPDRVAVGQVFQRELVSQGGSTR
jgi:shikimate dehydrogenase